MRYAVCGVECAVNLGFSQGGLLLIYGTVSLSLHSIRSVFRFKTTCTPLAHARIHMPKVPCGTAEPRASIEPSREGAGPRPYAARLDAPASSSQPQL